MERKMMSMLPKRVIASFMCEKGLWRILFAQSTGAMFPDNGANFLSSWYQTEVNCCSTSFYKRKILKEMREEAKKRKKGSFPLQTSAQMYFPVGSEVCFSLPEARRGDGSLSQEQWTSVRS